MPRRLAPGLISLLCLTALASAEPLWIAVGFGGRRVLSRDGVQWKNEQRWPVEAGGVLRAIAYGQGRFVAVGGSGGRGRALLTMDGANWQEWPEVPAEIGTVSFGEGRFVAVHGGELLWSTGERPFTPGERLPWAGEIRPQHSACGDTEAGFRFCVTGEREEAGEVTAWRAVTGDGERWDQSMTGTAPALGLAYGAGHFVVVGRAGLVETSHDGQAWERQNLGGEDDLERVLWTGAKFVAQGRHVWSSPDGEHWQREQKDWPGSVLWVEEQGTAMALGKDGRLWISRDWERWEAAGLAADPRLLGVGFRR